MFGKIGMGELLVILVVVLLIFGPTKLPALAKSMGEAMREFRKGTNEVTKNVENFVNEPIAEAEPKKEPVKTEKTEETK